MKKEKSSGTGGNQERQPAASFPELNPNPVLEVDTGGRVYFINKAAKQLFPGLSAENDNHPFLSDLATVATALKKGKRKSFTREIKIGGAWYEQAFHMVSDSQRMHIYAFDITERKKTEEEMKKLSAAIAQSTDWVAITDRDGIIEYVNDAVERILGYERGALRKRRQKPAWSRW